MILTLALTPTLTQPVTAEAEGTPKAKAPQETKTRYICPLKHGPRGFAWRGMGRKRHRERYPECQYEPFGVSYKTTKLKACVEAAECEADEKVLNEDARSRAIKRARNTFFSEVAEEGIAEWRAGRGRAMPLKRRVDGGRLVRIFVPPEAQPGDFFAHDGVKGLPIKRTDDGRYMESKEEDVWEQEPDACSDEATLACPIGPVPDPRPAFMVITVWARGPRPSEAAKAAAKAAEAAAWDEEEALAFADDDDDDADNEPDDAEEEGEAEEDGAAPAAAAPADAVAAPAVAEPAAAPTVAPAAPIAAAGAAAAPAADAVAAPAAAPAVAPAEPAVAPAAPIAAAAPAAAPAADANARIETAVAAAVAEATQRGMSAAEAHRKVRCSRALTSKP